MEVESQLESEQILQELATQPSSVYKAPTNRYQHFVNTYVLTNQTMKWVDAVKCAQVEWKERVLESKDQYIAALRKAVEHLKHNRMKRINSFLINFINCRLCTWCVVRYVAIAKTVLCNSSQSQPDSFQPTESIYSCS